MNHNLLFGYRKTNPEDGTPLLSIFLSRDGTLSCSSAEPRTGNLKKVSFTVSDECVRTVSGMIAGNRDWLARCAERINSPSEAFSGENVFIFDGLLIADWDLSRWFLEEDRRKHPEYYANSVKVYLTENYIRRLFDEICSVIEADEKEMQYSGAFLTDL